MTALATLTPVLRVLHLFITLAMIGVVLIQRSEGGGLGIGAGGRRGEQDAGQAGACPEPQGSAEVTVLASASTPTDTDVAIIGAGVAGLAAATTLRAAGLRVELLEAAAHVGGRAYTT